MEELKTLLVLSKEVIRRNMNDGVYDKEYTDDISSIENVYEGTASSMASEDASYNFRIKDSLSFVVKKVK